MRAAQVDIIILAMMGFLVYHKEQVQLAEYKVDSEGFVRAANRLMSWDSAVVLEDLRSWIPTAEADTVGGGPHGGGQPLRWCQDASQRRRRGRACPDGRGGACRSRRAQP